MVVPPVAAEVPLTARLEMPDAAADDRVSAAAGPVPGLVDKPAAVHRADPLTYTVDGSIAPAGLWAAVLENVAVCDVIIDAVACLVAFKAEFSDCGKFGSKDCMFSLPACVELVAL